MATKTITIDLEAYRRLKAVRKENESFSQVIKRVVPKPFDIRDFEKMLRGPKLSKEAVDAINEHIEMRHVPSNRIR